MAYRNLMIESPARLSVKDGQLLIETDALHSVPVEDISALLIEDRRTTITTAALSLLGWNGCALFVCDEKHLPCAVLEPFAQHSRNLSVLRSQLEMTEPMKKRLWQSVVTAKIRNQSLCLRLCGKADDASGLERMASSVRSGDPGNVEAAAAMRYFPALFHDGFTRDEECLINSALNYGYAILRGCLARCLTVYGFHPAMGLHHRNMLNSFNLADDLMEPFRPVVDLLVVAEMREGEVLSSAQKRRLFQCLSADILSGGQHHSVAYAAERLVQSLTRSVTSGKPELVLPELLPWAQHAYE